MLFGFISLILALIIFSFPRKLNHSNKSVSSKKEKERLNELVILNDAHSSTNNNTNEDSEVGDSHEKEASLKVNGVHQNNHSNVTNAILETLEQTGSLL